MKLLETLLQELILPSARNHNQQVQQAKCYLMQLQSWRKTFYATYETGLNW